METYILLPPKDAFSIQPLFLAPLLPHLLCLHTAVLPPPHSNYLLSEG